MHTEQRMSENSPPGGSTEFERFMFNHRHFFIGLLKDGYSRKELLASFEANLVSSLPILIIQVK